jgi:Flp pilus assembly protein TadG
MLAMHGLSAPRAGVHRAPLRVAAERRAVAALEFALVAPIMGVMILGVFDASRALLAWQQTQNAAQAIAQAAEKLSVVTSSTTPQLTSAQMQEAMSTIYAEMPGLSAGSTPGSGGVLAGYYAVTLSEVLFYYAGSGGAATLCPYANVASCGQPQYPYVLWTSYLNKGGSYLLSGSNYWRPCDVRLNRVYPSWSYAGTTGSPPVPLTRLNQMVDPSDFGALPVVLSPQVVADVEYQFQSIFSDILPAKTTITFLASAALPTPVGDNSTTIAFSGSADAAVDSCTQPTTP